MSENTLRKKHTGEPGNGGQFGTTARSEPTSQISVISQSKVRFCAECGGEVADDPAGSPGVTTHLDEHGDVDYDANADHVAIPDADFGDEPFPDLDRRAAFRLRAAVENRYKDFIDAHRRGVRLPAMALESTAMTRAMLNDGELSVHDAWGAAQKDLVRDVRQPSARSAFDAPVSGERREEIGSFLTERAMGYMDHRASDGSLSDTGRQMRDAFLDNAAAVFGNNSAGTVGVEMIDLVDELDAQGVDPASISPRELHRQASERASIKIDMNRKTA